MRLKVEISSESESNFDEIVPEIYRRQRSQLQDAILNAHFYFGGNVNTAVVPLLALAGRREVAAA